jgi:thiol-disulfide isomerase/thioredoxin
MKLVQCWKSLRNRPRLALVFDLSVVILVLLSIHHWNTRELPKGSEVPSLALMVLDPPAFEQQLPKNGVGIVYFFAPWCSYCRTSIDNLDQLVSSGEISWARTVALDYDSIDQVRQFVTETNLSQPVLLGNRKTSEDWNISAFPTYFVFDSEGNIRARSVGYSTSLGMWFRSKMAQQSNYQED